MIFVEDADTGTLLRAAEALEAAQWELAFELFSKAVHEEALPRAYEGLSWAAWWRDDATTVFDARERAYSLYRSDNDSRGAARMAIWLAVDNLDFRGAMAIAEGWLTRAENILATLSTNEPQPEQGWYYFINGYFAVLRGDTDAAIRFGSSSEQVGKETRVADLEILGLALQGIAQVARADVEQGMRRLGSAANAALTERCVVPISAAWTFCFVVTACLKVFDFARGSQWCARIEQFSERYGSRYMRAFCHADYGIIYTWQGDWDKAEHLLVAAVEEFSHSRPAMKSIAVGALARAAPTARPPRRDQRTVGNARLRCPGAAMPRADGARARRSHNLKGVGRTSPARNFSRATTRSAARLGSTRRRASG